MRVTRSMCTCKATAAHAAGLVAVGQEVGPLPLGPLAAVLAVLGVLEPRRTRVGQVGADHRPRLVGHFEHPHCRGLVFQVRTQRLDQLGAQREHVAPAVLQHRLMLSYEAEAEGATPQALVRDLLAKVPTP